jgi:hypothetical protein
VPASVFFGKGDALLEDGFEKGITNGLFLQQSLGRDGNQAKGRFASNSANRTAQGNASLIL